MPDVMILSQMIKSEVKDEPPAAKKKKMDQSKSFV